MKEVTMYKADDGTIFKTKKEADEYEKIDKRIQKIMKPFGKIPKTSGCAFENGKYYIQHNFWNIQKAKKEFLELGREVFKQSLGFSFLGRYCDDSGKKNMNSAWRRLDCMDDKGREWGQGYYVSNPNDDATEIKKA